MEEVANTASLQPSRPSVSAPASSHVDEEAAAVELAAIKGPPSDCEESDHKPREPPDGVPCMVQNGAWGAVHAAYFNCGVDLSLRGQAQHSSNAHASWNG